jgi:hypothetical protein
MPAASSPNGSMIEGVTTSAFRPKQQPGAPQEEQSSSASASLPTPSTGTPVVHLGYPNASAKFTRTTRPAARRGRAAQS